MTINVQHPYTRTLIAEIQGHPGIKNTLIYHLVSEAIRANPNSYTQYGLTEQEARNILDELIPEDRRNVGSVAVLGWRRLTPECYA